MSKDKAESLYFMVNGRSAFGGLTVKKKSQTENVTETVRCVCGDDELSVCYARGSRSWVAVTRPARLAFPSHAAKELCLMGDVSFVVCPRDGWWVKVST